MIAAGIKTSRLGRFDFRNPHLSGHARIDADLEKPGIFKQRFGTMNDVVYSYIVGL